MDAFWQDKAYLVGHPRSARALPNRAVLPVEGANIRGDVVYGLLVRQHQRQPRMVLPKLSSPCVPLVEDLKLRICLTTCQLYCPAKHGAPSASLPPPFAP